jgi:acyl-CoA thioesterase
MHPDAPQQTAERAVAALYDRDPASRQLGMRVLEAGPGRAKVAMAVTAHMVNGHATCHGGLIFALADSAFAFACNSYNQNTLAAAASIDYLAPARLDDTLTAEAREVWRARRSGIYEVTVSNQHGERVALFRGRSHQVDGKVIEDSRENP